MKEEVRGSLAVDAMGSDKGPVEVVQGLKLALDAMASTTPRMDPILLVGRQEELEPALSSENLAQDPRVRIVHADDVIGMDEKPMQAIKKKRNASMMIALDLVKSGSAQAILSCGNTGALMGGGTIKLRALEGVDRPALATIIPGLRKFTVLIDSGANPDATPVHLCHNAVLGSHFARVVLGIDEPKVGLLTIGTEEGKGGERVTETHHLMRSIKGLIRYDGLVEGYHLFDGEADVIVCDGFVGNVVLKACESLFHVIGDYLKQEITATPMRKLGAMLSRGAFRNLKDHFSPSEYGAAPFLGLKAPVFKSHGSSDRHAIAGGIKVALNVVQHDMTERILEDIRGVNRMIQPPQRD
ncbi:MAG: phosphate acyltransferase PlsX [Puniceicoccaceae bacterium]